jgi:hypothetical protein
VVDSSGDVKDVFSIDSCFKCILIAKQKFGLPEV